MGRTRTLFAVEASLLWPIAALPQEFGNWEVDVPAGSDTVEELRASQGLAASDLHGVEYLPKLSVVCERGSVGPYGPNRTRYAALKVRMSWFAQHLPREFETLDPFVRGGDRNSVWVPFGRVWGSNGTSQLITIGTDDPSSAAIETVKIELAEGAHKGYRFTAEVLDSGLAEAFLKAWNPLGQIPVVLLDARARDLNRMIELRGMKPAVDRVLARCGRGAL
jgi:hypothetical protein